MNYSLIIQSPLSSDSSISAFKFASALIASKHSIYRLFFYGDGVFISNSHITPPQDEHNTSKLWADLIQANNLDAVVCIAAALKRGVLNAQECERYDLKSAVLDPAYDLSGLGQLIDATAHSDKVITFA